MLVAIELKEVVEFVRVEFDKEVEFVVTENDDALSEEMIVDVEFVVLEVELDEALV